MVASWCFLWCSGVKGGCFSRHFDHYSFPVVKMRTLDTGSESIMLLVSGGASRCLGRIPGYLPPRRGVGGVSVV